MYELYVPEKWLNAVQACQSDLHNPVELRPFAGLVPANMDDIYNSACILLVDANGYTKVKNVLKKQSNAPKGKIILAVTPDEAQAIDPKMITGVDLITETTHPNVLAFKINRALQELTNDLAVEKLRETEIKQGKDLETLNLIGMALSTEKDLNKLLDLIVLKCREMTWADAGSLYMIVTDPKLPEDQDNFLANKKMLFQVAQNDSVKVPFRSFMVDITKTSIYGYAAITQQYLKFDDAYFIPAGSEYGWGGKAFDKQIGYRTKSMLTVPMVNYRGETIAVIQLINRKRDPTILLTDPEECVKDILPFSDDDIRMILSISSQASIAIQNAQFVDSIKGLFDGFINASVRAIESRDPTTSGHSQRVATLTVALAEKVTETTVGPYKDVRFSEDQIQEMRYASLLHDFGKIGVREHVLVKAKKLYPNELQSVMDRFSLIRRTIQLEQALKQVKSLVATDKEKALVAVQQNEIELNNRIKEMEEVFEFIKKCNEPTVLAQGGFDRLNEIAQKTFLNWEDQSVPYLTEPELISLSVAKGSLNEADRKEIESHVVHTYNFLSGIPWTPNLRHVADIAHAHHEKLDGTGYPNQLKADQIPIQSKMMSIADIFDALTAWDRPYKKAIPIERALDILREESTHAHIDGDLLEVFIMAELYKLVQNKEGSA